MAPRKFVHLPVLGRNEQIEGWIDCVCALYDCSREHLLREGLSAQKTLNVSTDYDLCDGEDRILLLEAIGGHRDHRLLDDISMLSSKRGQFCAVCFNDDVIDGRLPRFQLQWAHPLRTVCSLHRTPLLQWKYRAMNAVSRSLPRSIIDRYLSSNRQGVPRKKMADRIVDDYGLRLSAIVGDGLRNRDPRYFGFAQQASWEALILGDDDHRCFPFDASAFELREITLALASALMSSFGRSADTPLAEVLSWTLGPTWLFAPFKRSSSADLKEVVTKLSDIENPAVRRSVLYSTLRLLLTAVSDVDFSSTDGTVVGSAVNPSFHGLRALPEYGRNWLITQMTDWPEPIKGIMEMSLHSR